MKSSKSTIQKRQEKIMNYLQEVKSIDTFSLAKWLKVSEITVRRDLDQMAGKGLVERFFGGVRLIERDFSQQPDGSIVCDDDILIDAIAKKAAEMINDKDVVFINSSSTAMRVVKFIQARAVVVVTNNAKMISQKHDPRVEIILTGGEVYGNKQSLIGEFALSTIAKIKATKCIIGVSGISVKGGITSEVLPETAINQLMLKRCSGSKIVITDGSKVGRERNFMSGSITDVTHLVTDSSADAGELDRIRSKGLKVTIIEPRDQKITNGGSHEN